MAKHFRKKHDIEKNQYRAARAIKQGDEPNNRFLICPEDSVITDRIDIHAINKHSWKGDKYYHKRAALFKRASEVSGYISLHAIIGIPVFVNCANVTCICIRALLFVQC